MPTTSSNYIKNFNAEGALVRFRIAKPGAAAGGALQAAAVADKMIGVVPDISAALGERADVILAGPADLEYGGAVAAGDLITSDALGRGVVAAPAAGVNNRTIGVAIIAGALGDVGLIEVTQGSVQG
jgi:hypothetical protein